MPRIGNWSPRFLKRAFGRTGRGCRFIGAIAIGIRCLPDTLAQMANDGVRRALGFFTSAYSSYSGCRQYREDIERARQASRPRGPGGRQAASVLQPSRLSSSRSIERMRAALDQIPPPRRAAAQVIYTAHSIPMTMADGCRYADQLAEAARLVSGGTRVVRISPRLSKP